ncbi:MAG: flavodoxin domain-containing protein [Clostridia bacterium]|nr:flavodoxin domain-containing protein [Clostridia bacterium]
MKTLIVYATKNGTTEKAAKILGEKLGGADLKNIACDNFDLAAYDRVLVGSNVRMGTVDRKIRAFLLSQIGILLQKELGLFLCCCFPKQEQAYFESNVPSQLLEHAKATAALGGELDRAQLKGTDKLVVKMVLKADHAQGILRTFALENDRIDAFVEKLTEM